MVHIHRSLAARPAGFTLVETIVALVLSSIVIILVSTTFLVQSQYYSSQALRAGAHDNARAATEMMASEIRSAMPGGFVVAGNKTLTIRSPIVLGVICSSDSATRDDVHTEGGESGFDTQEVAGVAVRDDATGAWQYQNATWGTLNGSDASSASNCAANGADTTGAASEFHRLLGLQGTFSAPPPGEGDILMLFRETTFTFQRSELDPRTWGLFRQIYGDSLVEFATGMDSITAQFHYRTDGTTYVNTVTGASLGDIDVVRISADARKPAATGGRDDITFGWSVNVALRNVR